MSKVLTRKTHKKSRNGCLHCKSRRCDEQKPRCANCVKQGADCEYRSSTSREASYTTPSPSGAPTSISSGADGTGNGIGAGTFSEQQPLPGSAPADGTSIGVDTTLNIPQLRLLHHYTTVTAKTLAVHTDAEDVFQITLPALAFSHPYLLHATLSLSALHLSRLARTGSEAQSYLFQAEQYRSAALHAFQTTVKTISDSNFKPVLLFTGTLFPHACITCFASSSSPSSAFSSLISNFIVTRSIRPMVTSVYTKMQESELSRLIPQDVRNIDWHNAVPPVDTELIQLRTFSQVIHHLYPPDIIAAYSAACRLLELVFHVAANSLTPPSDALLKTWIHLVPEKYMELLAERQPGSLVVFAHFAVLMYRAEACYWYMEGVAERILEIVDELVPGEWRAWLEWPRGQVGLRGREGVE